MTETYVATATITIDAAPRHVWSVLTDPDAIREFMFGTEVSTDWTVGGPITWQGVWQGKEYQDKGTILELEPGRRLVHTHLSGLSAQDDRPENYHTLVWTLDEAEAGKTRLTLTQDKNATVEEAEHSQAMWESLVTSVKEIAERS